MARRKSSGVSEVEETIILVNNWVLCGASLQQYTRGVKRADVLQMTLNRRFTNDFSCHMRNKVI